MGDISQPLQSHIDTGATTLCYIWTLTRRDGLTFGFTDHDLDLEIDGVIYRAASGMSGGDIDGDIGFSIDNGHITSLLSDERITADDINAGLFDRAELSCAVVNWQDVTQSRLMARGQLGEITQAGAEFKAEWLGEGVKLERTQGRVFSRLCDASFGDSRCGLNAADFAEGTQCPRRFTACRDRFGNVKNFRGFPYLLGDDALTAAPRESELRDGGSRYKGLLS